jgi:ubiquitin carboxyl-terminal hydrolase 4/11
MLRISLTTNGTTTMVLCSNTHGFLRAATNSFLDSTVTKTQARSVVTPAAYLLFYRRCSAVPLGPLYLQKIVERNHQDGEADSETSTDASDLGKSGNGQRLGDSSPNGSSSALVGPVAARPPLGVGLAGAVKPQQMGILDEDDDNLPTYEEDEGIAMDPREGSFSILHASAVMNPVIGPSWSFDRLESLTGGPPQVDDGGSDVAADGDDEEYQGLGRRIQEDFGDDDEDQGPYPSMPTSSPIPDLVLPDHIEESVEHPVAEVRVSEEDANGDVHLKRD